MAMKINPDIPAGTLRQMLPSAKGELRDAILARIDTEEAALLAAVDEAVAGDPAAELRWTGRTVAVKSFPTHMRSESAVHRWDLVGDDITATEHLADPELLAHAVRFIGKPLLVKGLARLDGPLTARIRTPGTDDLLIDACRASRAGATRRSARASGRCRRRGSRRS